jgi:ribulose-5-phosphate 4-epimerase/fuculose-1-phosphate aldolase
MTVSYQAEREQVALACRMLAVEGLAETTLGHVSLRVADRHFLVRARRASERGLLFTTADDIALTEIGAGDYQDLPVFGQEYYDQVWRCYAAKADRMGNQHA